MTGPGGTACRLRHDVEAPVPIAGSSIHVPVAPGLTEARMAWYFAPGGEFEASREAIPDRWLGPSRSFAARQGIRSQDHRCMELQQAARGSPAADDVGFPATREANVRYFQDGS